MFRFELLDYDAVMKVLIAPDKFKGTLTALEVAEAIGDGWSAARPHDELVLVPMADGGTGTAAVIESVVEGAEPVIVPVLDALSRPCTAAWIRLPDGRALVEAAAAVGVDFLAPQERDPFRASSYGVGQLLAAAAEAGAAEIFVGLGGTANVDGGAGMAAALGHRLHTADGIPIGPGAEGMGLTAKVELGPPLESEVFVLSDVTNPLLGPDGAVSVYGPQKGASAEDFETLEAAMAKFATVVERDLPGGPWRDLPGAGAAGGLGFALSAFLGARFRVGADVVAQLVGFERSVLDADVVVTGEGKLDSQTGWGKTPGFVAQSARRSRAKVLAIAGIIEDDAGAAFDAAVGLGPEGLRRPAGLVRERAAELARLM